MDIIKELGKLFESKPPKRKSSMKKLPKMPKGLKARVNKLEREIKREKEIQARKKEIEALKKKAETLKNQKSKLK